LIISSRSSSSLRFLLCGSIVSAKYRHLYFNYGCYMEQYLTDMGMPFGYPRISIPGLAHYGGGRAQGLKD
jgi:hypothetical protein